MRDYLVAVAGNISLYTISLAAHDDIDLLMRLLQTYNVSLQEVVEIECVGGNYLISLSAIKHIAEMQREIRELRAKVSKLKSRPPEIQT